MSDEVATSDEDDVTRHRASTPAVPEDDDVEGHGAQIVDDRFPGPRR